MKTGLLVILIALVLCLSLLSACDLFGGKSDAQRQQEYYQQQVDAYNQEQEAYQQQQEEIRKALEEALQEWADTSYGNQ
jgi:hypothetical protein